MKVADRGLKAERTLGVLPARAGGGSLRERWLFRDASQRTSRKPGRGNKLKEVGRVDFGFEEAANHFLHKRVRERRVCALRYRSI